MRRALAIGLLAGAFAAVAVLFLFEWIHRPPPPPLIAVVPEFTLVERSGAPVTRADLLGRPWVADFFFTRCAVYCPRLTARMQELGERLPARARVRRVSISVDPEHDTPEVLRDYAAKWGIGDDADWLLLTGGEVEIRELVRHGFLLPVEDDPDNVAMPILHSNRFALVDAEGRLRGTYEAFEPDGLERLLADLAAVEAEHQR